MISIADCPSWAANASSFTVPSDIICDIVFGMAADEKIDKLVQRMARNPVGDSKAKPYQVRQVLAAIAMKEA